MHSPASAISKDSKAVEMLQPVTRMDVAASPSFFLLNEKQSEKQSEKNKFKNIRPQEDNDGSWTTVSRKTKGSRGKLQRSRRDKQKRREQSANKKKPRKLSSEEPVKWTVPHKNRAQQQSWKSAQQKTYKQVTAGKPGKSAFKPYDSKVQQGPAEKRRSEISEEGGNHAKEKLRLKLWNILFRNVSRAVDELYHMCEYETAEAQCEEAIQALQASTADFEELKSRIQSQAEFSRQLKSEEPAENSRKYPVVAWEIKRSSSERSKPSKAGPETPETDDVEEEKAEECKRDDTEATDARQEDERREPNNNGNIRSKPTIKSAWNKKLTLRPPPEPISTRAETHASDAEASSAKIARGGAVAEDSSTSLTAQKHESATTRRCLPKEWLKKPSKGFLWSDDVEDPVPDPPQPKPKFAKDLSKFLLSKLAFCIILLDSGSHTACEAFKPRT